MSTEAVTIHESAIWAKKNKKEKKTASSEDPNDKLWESFIYFFIFIFLEMRME